MVGGPIFSWRYWPCFRSALTKRLLHTTLVSAAVFATLAGCETFPTVSLSQRESDVTRCASTTTVTVEELTTRGAPTCDLVESTIVFPGGEQIVAPPISGSSRHQSGGEGLPSGVATPAGGIVSHPTADLVLYNFGVFGLAAGAKYGAEPTKGWGSEDAITRGKTLDPSPDS